MKIVGYEKSDKGYFYKKVKENNEIKKIRISADEYLQKKKIQKGGRSEPWPELKLNEAQKNLWELDNLLLEIHWGDNNNINTCGIKYDGIIQFIKNNEGNIDYMYKLPNNNGTILERILYVICDYFNNINIMFYSSTLEIIEYIKTPIDKTINKNPLNKIIEKHIQNLCNLFVIIYKKIVYKNGNFKNIYLEVLNKKINEFNKTHPESHNKYYNFIYRQLNNIKEYINNYFAKINNNISNIKPLTINF